MHKFAIVLALAALPILGQAPVHVLDSHAYYSFGAPLTEAQCPNLIISGQSNGTYPVGINTILPSAQSLSVTDGVVDIWILPNSGNSYSVSGPCTNGTELTQVKQTWVVPSPLANTLTVTAATTPAGTPWTTTLTVSGSLPPWGLWTPTYAYPIAAYAVDATGHTQLVTTAGTSGSSTPTWNDAGGTTTDGSVTWTDQGPLPHNGYLTSSFNAGFQGGFLVTALASGSITVQAATTSSGMVLVSPPTTAWTGMGTFVGAGPLTLQAVTPATRPSPNMMFLLSQMLGSGAQIGQSPIWTGLSWMPGNPLDFSFAQDWEGAYNPATSYSINQVVYYGVSSYASLIPSNIGNEPDTSPTAWAIIATGTVGPSGITSATTPLVYDSDSRNISCPTCIASAAGNWSGTWQAYSPSYFQPAISGAPGTWPSTFPPITSGNWAGTWQTYAPSDFQTAITTGTTAQYLRGDLSLGTMPTISGSAMLKGSSGNAVAATDCVDYVSPTCLATMLSSGTLPASVTTLNTAGTASIGGALNAAGNIYANVGGNTPGSLHLGTAASDYVETANGTPSVECTTANEPGSGTSGTPTCSVSAGGTDISGTLTIGTATAPSVTAKVISITFAQSHPQGVNACQIRNIGPQLTNTVMPYISTDGAPTSTGWYLTSGSTSLAATTTYQFTYICL